jgi:hypothetical protein
LDPVDESIGTVIKSFGKPSVHFEQESLGSSKLQKPHQTQQNENTNKNAVTCSRIWFSVARHVLPNDTASLN